MKTTPNVIDVDDNDMPDARPVDIPVIAIEKAAPEPQPTRKSGRSKLLAAIAATLGCVVIVLCVAAAWAYFISITPDVTPGVSDEENFSLLETPYTSGAKGTVATSDSILGVTFDLYSLSGLKASLENVMPDTTDTSLVLFMRSADYHPDGSVIGTTVINGKSVQSKGRRSRQGYLAISPEGRAVIGISVTDKVSDHAIKSGGSFFRQFALLGDGELPSTYALHGKVERAAIGRMADGELYYIVTRDKESMYDFADALREYGFVDAIYITGGNSYTFHRDTTGKAHISSSVIEKIEKYHDSELQAPLLVFRR